MDEAVPATFFPCAFQRRLAARIQTAHPSSPSLGQHRAADARLQRRFHFTHRDRRLEQIKEDVSRQPSADYGTAVAEVVNGKDQLPQPKFVEHEADAVRRVVER